jgi:predicted nucleotidyltransferase
MMDLARALQDFAALFEELDVAYAVMGGIAVRVYGIPRPTHDVDFTVAIPRSRLGEFYRAAAKLGYTIPDPYLTGWVDRVAGMPVVKARLYLESHGVDIDLFLAESEFQQELLARRRRAQIDHWTVWLVSPEDLILLKLLAGRPRDLADIGDILFTQGQLDEAYLRQWAKQLGVLADLERALASPT